MDDTKTTKNPLLKLGWGKKETKLLVMFAVLFLLSACLAFVTSMNNKTETVDLFSKFSTIMLENIDVESQTSHQDGEQSWLTTLKQSFMLFVNNINVNFFVMIGAALTLYFYPTIVVIANGIVIGFVFAAIGILEPNTNLFLLFITGILPHGILEIPAILLSAVIGIRWGRSGYRALRKKEQPYSYKTVTKQTIQFLAFILVPLLLVAALIEGFITPLLIV